MSDRMMRVTPSTPVQNAEESLSIGTNSLDSDAPLASIDLEWAVTVALARCGLSAKQACAYMDLDESQWSKQLRNRDNAQISLQRLTKLPRQFWLELLTIFSAPLDVVIGHPDIADRVANALLLSVQHAVAYAQQDRALRHRRTA